MLFLFGAVSTLVVDAEPVALSGGRSPSQACGFPFLAVIATLDGQKQLVMRLEGALPVRWRPPPRCVSIVWMLVWM